MITSDNGKCDMGSPRIAHIGADNGVASISEAGQAFIPEPTDEGIHPDEDS
jgi:hypothetical protein